jgi:hypothetical protein
LILYVIHHEHREAVSSTSLLLKEFEERDAMGLAFGVENVRHMFGWLFILDENASMGCNGQRIE